MYSPVLSPRPACAAEMAKIGIRLFREHRLPPHTFIPAEVRRQTVPLLACC